MDLPCRLNHHLLESKELEHYTDVLYNAFDGFCSGVQSGPTAVIYAQRFFVFEYSTNSSQS